MPGSSAFLSDFSTLISRPLYTEYPTLDILHCYMSVPDGGLPQVSKHDASCTLIYSSICNRVFSVATASADVMYVTN